MKYLANLKLQSAEERTTLVKQYEILIGAQNSFNNMRSVTNMFYASVNSIIIASLSYGKDVGITPNAHPIIFLTIASMGAILCISWILLLFNHAKIIHTYNNLIKEVESYLPAPLFTVSINLLDGKRTPGSTVDTSSEGLPKKELLVPIFFITAYVTYAFSSFFIV